MGLHSVTFPFKEWESALQALTSIHDLVEFVSQILNNPVTIEAPNFDLIAYCRNTQTIDPARQGTILSKKVPDNIVSYLTNSGIVESIEKSTGALSIPAFDDLGLSQRVVCAIKQHQKILGHIWVQETNQLLSATDKEFLLHAANRAAALLSSMQRQKEITTQTFDLYYTKLLQGFFINEKQALLEGQLISVQVPERLCLILFQAQEAIHPKFLAALRFHSLYTSKSTYWFVNGSTVFVIVGSPSSIPGSSILLAQELIGQLKKKDDFPFDYTIALSKEYDQLTQLRKCYEEAMIVLNLTAELNIEIPHKYEDLGFYKLLPVIQQHYKEEHYTNEKIRRLQQYDAANNSDLLTTMIVYLQFNCKTKESAEALFIHPNTLNYRLKRISELCAINFEEMNERITLYIDALILKFLSDK